MPITLPDKTEVCVSRALLYLQGLGLDKNNKSDLDYAISFAESTYKLCPGRNSGVTELEISSSISQDKITLTRESRRNIRQIIEGLKILKRKKG